MDVCLCEGIYQVHPGFAYLCRAWVHPQYRDPDPMSFVLSTRGGATTAMCRQGERSVYLVTLQKAKQSQQQPDTSFLGQGSGHNFRPVISARGFSFVWYRYVEGQLYAPLQNRAGAPEAGAPSQCKPRPCSSTAGTWASPRFFQSVAWLLCPEAGRLQSSQAGGTKESF